LIFDVLRFGILISHLKEEKICKLLKVIIVAYTIITEDVTVIPDF
jgi:hypothetical protein